MRRAVLLSLALVAAACGGRPVPTSDGTTMTAADAPWTDGPVQPDARTIGAALRLLPAAAPRSEGGPPTVVVEVAATGAARQRGLGGRETLADGAGMLFVYADSQARRFWMKDCLVALDIAFLDEKGRVLKIATLPPGAGLSGPDIPAARCDAAVRYVLEVRARWFAEQGLGEGDLVDLGEVVAGVRAE